MASLYHNSFTRSEFYDHFRYPFDEAATVAISTIKEHCNDIKEVFNNPLFILRLIFPFLYNIINHLFFFRRFTLYFLRMISTTFGCKRLKSCSQTSIWSNFRYLLLLKSCILQEIVFPCIPFMAWISCFLKC